MIACRSAPRLAPLVALAALLLAPLRPAATVAMPAAPPTAIPATPAGQALRWALDQINGGVAALTIAAIDERFGDAFLADLPPAQVLATFQQLAATIAPVRFSRVEGFPDGDELVAVLTTATTDWRVSIGVAPETPPRIVDLSLAPVWLPDPLPRPPTTWAALDRQLLALAPQVSFLAAEIADGQCRPVHALAAERPLATASTFKLFVLGELARQIEAGQASWDEELAIHDEWKSLPNGDMRLEPDGATFPLRHFAEQMIVASDNTAADHLIHRLGRENVEAFLVSTGHGEPALNIPLLTTREWFALKVAVKPARVSAFLAADVPHRREILADEVDGVPVTEEQTLDWPAPKRIDTIEWFSSATDLCRVMATLQRLAGNPALAPLYGIMSINPGLAFDARAWTYVGYKAGYETGVWNKTWLLRRADGRWFVLTAGLNDPRREIDGAQALRLMVPAAGLLAAVR